MRNNKKLLKLYFKKKEPLLVYGNPWFFADLMAQYYDNPTKGLMSVHHCENTHFSSEIISFELPQILAERIRRAYK